MDGIAHIILTSAGYIVPFLFVLTILVFVHEFGHYWVARRNGVRVETFSIGFGPEIFGFNNKAGTRWKFSLIPLGGYVKMFGDSDPASRPSDIVKTMTDNEKAVSFHHKRVGQRAAILAAGPGANYLFAIVLLTGLMAFYPHPMPLSDVGGVVPGSPAEEAGIKVGDRILEANGNSVDRFWDLSRQVRQAQDDPVVLKVRRQGDILSVTVTPELVEQKDMNGAPVRVPMIGLQAETGPYPIHRAFVMAVAETWNITWTSLKGLGEMVVGQRDTKELGGPIRIAEMSGNAARGGVTSLFWFMALLSISLGLLNLFPIPVLDGGHLLFYLLEFIRGRPLSPKMQEYSFRIGFALVLSLLFFALWNDLIYSNFTAPSGG